MMFAGAMLVAMGVDTVFGWPARIYAAVGHPVTWAGALIRALEAAFNRRSDSAERQRLAGVGVAVFVILAAVLAASLLVWLLPGGWVGAVLTGVLAWPLVAVKSMREHVEAVARPLEAGDLGVARGAVAMIVGRDPAQLDANGVARAALESLAENTSDGIVAPLFWGLIFGLPGIAAYKAINTMDSMIGHKSERYLYFGWAAARIDDVVNLIPARLTGALFAGVSGRAAAGWACMWADAGKHRSPNAGWPEAAVAGGLGIRLSGPRVYDDRVSDEPWVNAGAPDPGAGDLWRGLEVYRRAMLMLAAGLALLAMGQAL